VDDLSSLGSPFYSNKFGGVLELDRQHEDRLVFITMLLTRNILTVVLI
jgi:hypothetical protein